MPQALYSKGSVLKLSLTVLDCYYVNFQQRAVKREPFTKLHHIAVELEVGYAISH